MAYEAQTENYEVCMDEPLITFINNIKTRAYADFAVDIANEDLEIVVGGQQNHAHGWAAELAPALEPHYDITFREYFEDRIDNPYFYLRKVPRRYEPEHAAVPIEDEDADHEAVLEPIELFPEEEDDRCVICMEEAPQVRFQTCRHMCTCHHCYNNLRGTSDHCPLCRTYIDGFVQV
jgi:hypothetical protein